MKAGDWEFTNRALVFGLIFAVCFPLYSIDPQNITAVLANWLGAEWHRNTDKIARLLFACAALLLAAAALLRTWASSFLNAGVVYASEVKSESLVADGPYRRVRHPLYLANVMMAVGLGAMMSRVGFVLAVILMLVFCYRLILREEGELAASQGASYRAYCSRVPRLWPGFLPRVAASGGRQDWKAGFLAESWYWGFALSVAAFAITLELKFFFIILAASLVLFWVVSTALRKRA
jgi:protein-S-isoprenylcysteine O-methyltransferase Ste14